jgi:hypothetical protein
LWSEEGATLVPKLEELHMVFEEQKDSSLRSSSVREICNDEIRCSVDLIETEENSSNRQHRKDTPSLRLLLAEIEHQDKLIWDGVNSRATSRTLSRRCSFEGTLESFPPIEDIEMDVEAKRMPLPLPLSIEGWKSSNISTISVAPFSPTQTFDSPITPITPPQDIDFNALLRIKQAVSKARHRAMKNLENVLNGNKPIHVKQWEEIDNRTGSEELKLSIAKVWEKHAAEMGVSVNGARSTKHLNWHQRRNRFVPLRFSVAFPKAKEKRDKAEMQAEVEEKDPDGEWRRYRSKINKLRITKVKEIFRPAIILRLKKEAEQSSRMISHDIETDFEAPFRAFGIKIPDPTPSTAEILYLMTPAQHWLCIPFSEAASEINPFASLYCRYRALAPFEIDTPDDDSESSNKKHQKSDSSHKDGPDKLNLGRNLQFRFISHNAVQDFLREMWKERSAGEKASNIVNNALAMFWDHMYESHDIRKEAPLKNEPRDETGNVICELEQYHYVAAYLTAWTARCERYGW